MSLICFRKSISVFMISLALSLAFFSLPDTASDEASDTSSAKLKNQREKVTLSIKTDSEKKALTKEIVISEEGVTLNGKKLDLEKLADSAQVSISIESGSIVRFGEPILIKEDEIVNGDLLSFGGEVTVSGTVTGDVAVIGANLLLQSSGVIRGDVFTLGGTIHQEPGGKIRGQRVGVLPEHFRVYGPFPVVLRSFKAVKTLGLPLIFFFIISLLLVSLAGFFTPRHVGRIHQAIEKDPLKSLLLGFAALVAALPLFVLLCVTIIGIPVALIAQPIAYFIAGVMGLAGVSFFVGAKLHRGVRQTSTSPMPKILLGTLIIEAALILAWFFALGGDLFAPLFWLFYLIGWIVYLVASMAGLGAAIWTRFGTRSVGLASTSTPSPAQAPGSPNERSPDRASD